MLTEKLNHTIAGLVAAHELPGLAVGVVWENEIIYSQTFGVRNIRTQESLTSASLFHLASVSKPVVATAIMQLAERGRLNLDDAVADHLPYFKLADARYRRLTVQQMLSHVSGMPDVEDYAWDKPEYDDGAVARFVRSLADRRLIFEPGEDFAYSNMAYEVLGAVVAQLSGQTLEAYIAENIFRPLGMTTSTFLKTAVPPEAGVTPHLMLLTPTISEVYPYNRRHAASSTLHSNALEMGRWARANLNRGALDGARILEAASYDRLWRPYHQIDDDPPRAIGLSWFLGRHRDYQSVSHAGGDIGFSSNLVLLPEPSLGVIVMSNIIPAPLAAISRAVLDIVLGQEPELPKPAVTVPVGKVLQAEGFSAALKAHRQLQREQPDDYLFDVESFIWLAWGLKYAKQYDDAIAVLKLAQAAYPDEVDLPENYYLYVLLGDLYGEQGRREMAVEALQKALAVKPGDSSATEKLEALQNED